MGPRESETSRALGMAASVSHLSHTTPAGCGRVAKYEIFIFPSGFQGGDGAFQM